MKSDNLKAPKEFESLLSVFENNTPPNWKEISKFLDDFEFLDDFGNATLKNK